MASREPANTVDGGNISRVHKKSGKNLKSVIPEGDGVPLHFLEESNQEIHLDFLGRLPAVWQLISIISSV